MVEILVVPLLLLLLLLQVVVVDGGRHVLHDHTVVGMRGSQWNVLVLLKLVVKSRETVLLMNLTRGLINGLIVRRIHYLGLAEWMIIYALLLHIILVCGGSVGGNVVISVLVFHVFE